MLNRRLTGMDPVLESPRFEASCRVHLGRVPDTRLKMSGNE